MPPSFCSIQQLSHSEHLCKEKLKEILFQQHFLAKENSKMASKGIQLCFLLAIFGVLYHGASAQSGCSSTIVTLAPCLNYVSGSSSTPSSSCCSQLANVVQTQPRCLCSLLNGGGSQFGVTINQTLALALPGACNVQTPPISRCNASYQPSSPAAAPVGSPNSSPADAFTPDGSIPPSDSGVSSGTSSKTVPSNGSTSDGSIIRLPFTILVLLITSSAAAIIKF